MHRSCGVMDGALPWAGGHSPCLAFGRDLRGVCVVMGFVHVVEQSMAIPGFQTLAMFAAPHLPPHHFSPHTPRTAGKTLRTRAPPVRRRSVRSRRQG